MNLGRRSAAAAVAVATGHAHCWRCHRPIAPDAPWTLDTGAPAHVECHPNPSTRKQLASTQRKHHQTQSRLTW